MAKEASKNVIAGLWTRRSKLTTESLNDLQKHRGHLWMEHGHILVLSSFGVQVVGRILKWFANSWRKTGPDDPTICQIPLNIFHIFCSGAEWRTGSRGVYLQCPCLGLYSFKCWMCFYIDVLSFLTLQNVCSNLLFLLSCSLLRQQQMYCYTCIC